MKRFEKFPIMLLAVSAGTALLSVILRSILTLTSIDVRYGVYSHGTVLPNIYHIILAVACIALCVTAVIKAPARDGDYIIPVSDFTVFASCAAAFLLIFELFLSLYNIILANTEPSVFDILELCFSVPSIMYFLGLTRSKGKRSLALAVTSFFPTARCAVCLIRIYFDNTTLMTSPNKVLGELALLAAMIYFLSEARNQLGITSHRFYLAAASVAPILLFTSAVPNLLFSDSLSIGASDNYMRYAVEAVFALFIWARLAAYSKNPAFLPETIAVIENNE
ncbi:MAG: hypothetical protein IJ428_01980 [Clostridia bacterium]|nr:hypothetical protein [Clostridia bacterium]